MVIGLASVLWLPSTLSKLRDARVMRRRLVARGKLHPTQAGEVALMTRRNWLAAGLAALEGAFLTALLVRDIPLFLRK